MNFVPAYCFSDEVTGLSLGSNVQNNGIFCKVGNFYVFATDTKILFYIIENNDAKLSKTYSVPFHGTSLASISTSIMTINSDYVLIGCSYRNYESGYYWTNLVVIKLNVNNLNAETLSDIHVSSGTSVSTIVTFGQVIFKSQAGNYYLFFSAKDYNTYKVYLYKIYPSVSSIGSTSAERWLYGPTSYILSATDQNKAYIIGRNADGGLRYKIFLLDFVSYSFTTIATSPIDNDYSDYVYQVSYIYHNITSNYYYDVLIAYPHLSTNKQLSMNLIRFNDTYLDEDRQYVAVSSSVNKLRPFIVNLQLGASPSNLMNGNYDYVFVGENYNFKYFSFVVDLLETENPSLGTYGDVQSYQSKNHYYSSSNNVGGLQDVYSNVGLELDYQNGKGIADIFTAYSVYFSYSYELWNSTTKINPIGGILYIKQNVRYTFKAWLKANNVSDVQGYWKLYRGPNPNPSELHKTGLMFNSYLEIVFIESQIGNIYWMLKMYPTNYQISGESIDKPYQYFISSTQITIIPPGDVTDVKPPIDTGTGIFTTLFIPFMLMLAPALILSSFLGTAGLVIGLIFGVTLTAWCGVIPLWVVVISIFGIFVTLILMRGKERES